MAYGSVLGRTPIGATAVAAPALQLVLVGGVVGVGHGRLNGSGRGCARSRAVPASASDGGASTTRDLRAQAHEQPLEPRLGRHRQPDAQRAVGVASRRARPGRPRPPTPPTASSSSSTRGSSASGWNTPAGAVGGRRLEPLVEQRGRRDAVDPEAALGAREVAVPEHVEAAVLGVDEVRVDVALGARVAPVGVVVEVDAPVLGHRGAEHLEHVGAAEPEVDVEHLVGVDAEHGGQLRDAAAERAVLARCPAARAPTRPR